MVEVGLLDELREIDTTDGDFNISSSSSCEDNKAGLDSAFLFVLLLPS